MTAYRRVYDSRRLQADCQEPGSAPEPYTLGNRVWATFTFFTLGRENTLPEITRSAIHFLFLRSPSPVARY